MVIVERDGFEREGGGSLVTVDMHKGLNGNRAETRRNQTASWCGRKWRKGGVARESNWKNERGARLATGRLLEDPLRSSKGPLSFHPLSAHIFGNQPSPPCSSVNRITLPERRINFVDGGTPAERKCKGIVRESNLNSLETRVEQGEYGSSRVNNAPFVRFRHVGRWVISMVKVISQIVLLGGGCSRFKRRLRALRIYN